MADNRIKYFAAFMAGISVSSVFHYLLYKYQYNLYSTTTSKCSKRRKRARRSAESVKSAEKESQEKIDKNIPEINTIDVLQADPSNVNTVAEEPNIRNDILNAIIMMADTKQNSTV